MPGDEALYEPIEDLYPDSEDAHGQLVTWCLTAFDAADSHRQPYYDRWLRYHKLYRAYIKRKQGDWSSKVFIPHAFSNIETIMPRLLARLPRFVAMPVGPEDVVPAGHMETLLNYSAENSDFYAELAQAVKSSLKFGTGILKTYHRHDIETAYGSQPQMMPQMARMQQPVTDETGKQVLDTEGEPVFEDQEVEVGQVQVGMALMPYEYVAYDGPAAEAVDILNFWPAPEAEDIESARYVIQRVYRDMSDVLRHVEEGHYRLPPNLGPDDITQTEDEPLAKRLSIIDMGGTVSDATRKPVELLEFWTKDNRVITMANRKAILRVQKNPFNHGMKPYVRFVDYLQEHEFWGVGEIEVLEGLQDLHNALVNQRIDNNRVSMNGMWAVNRDAIIDLRQIRSRPGGVIEVNGVPKENIERFDPSDVTSSAFQEAAEAERLIEKVTGVNAYTMGTDSPSMNDTATGVAVLSEQSNSKFAMKLRLIEELALVPLAKQWGSIIQQFTSQERMLRILGPDGAWLFVSFDPESIQGALDYRILAESTAQTETIRRQQDMTLLQLLASVWPYAVPQLVIDLLRDYGKKDLASYMMGPQPMDPMAQAQQDQSLDAPVESEANYPQLPPTLMGGQLQTRLQPEYPGGRNQ